MKIPVISVSGSAYDLGYQHGKQMRQAIEKNFQFYSDLWKYFGGIEEIEILKSVQEFLPYIMNLDPGLIEELKGLSDGAVLQFEKIVALNCRYELSFAFMSNPDKSMNGGCTSYALLPEATRDHHMMIGQNWDMKPGLCNSCLILHISQNGRPQIIMHTEAGVIGHKGFNSSGIGVCLNFIRTERDTFRPGLPVWIKVRGILNSDSLTACMGILMNFEGPNSINILIGHRDGEAIDAECSPDDTFFLYAEGGVLTHTNHFLSNKLRVKDTGKILVPDTVIRSHRVSRSFKGKTGHLDVDGIKGILKDHFGFPNSICRHRDGRVHPNEQWETLTSMIIDLTKGEMLYTAGPPCTNQYENILMEQSG